MIFVDPVFNKSDKKNLRLFLKDWGVSLNQGYVKVKNEYAINGSNGLAPAFSNPYVPFSEKKLIESFFLFPGQ